MNASMNFTSGRELQELCNQALATVSKNGRDKISKAIELKIERIKERKKGAWGQPSGDPTYIKLLSRFYILLNDHVINADIERLGTEATTLADSKLRVVFITHEPCEWYSVDSVFHAMLNDNRYAVKAVYVREQHENKKRKNDNEIIDIYQNRYGVNVLFEDQYDMAMDNPDLVFYVKPYEGLNHKNSRYSHNSVLLTGARIVYISHDMETTRTFLEHSFQLPIMYHAWRHIVYGPIAKNCSARYGYRGGENVVIWGHPKADRIIHQDFSDHKIPKDWVNKINGRKTFIWNTNQTIMEEGLSTWTQHGEAVLNYFKEHDDIVLLWRPHMSGSELEIFKKDVNLHDNIILDIDDDYRPAFWVSDAAIIDGPCLFGEYIYMERPMIVTTNTPTIFWLWRELQECIPVAKKTEEIFEFIDMVRRDEDKYKQKRQQFRKEQYFLPETGTVGEYIRDKIYSDLVREISKNISDS